MRRLWLLILLCAFLAVGSADARMVVSLVSAGVVGIDTANAVGGTNATSPLDLTLNITTETNRILDVGFMNEGSDAIDCSVTYDPTGTPQAFTELHEIDVDAIPNLDHLGLFYCLQADCGGTGNQTIRIACTGTITGMNAGAVALYDAAQQAPSDVDSAGAASGTSDTISGLTVPAGAIVIDVIGNIVPTNAFTVGAHTELTAWAIDTPTGTNATFSGGYRMADSVNWTWNQSNDWAHAVAVFSPLGTEEPCLVMGAFGTYEQWWNGEYESDTDKACINSGASAVDASSIAAGVINTSSPISGTTDFKGDASDDYIRWAADSDADDVLTVKMAVKTPSTSTGNNTLFHLQGDANDNWTVYIADNSRVYSRYEYNSDSNYELAFCSGAMTDGNTYTIYATVDPVDSDNHCLKIDGIDCGSGVGVWYCEAEGTWAGFTDNPTSFSIGDDEATCLESGCAINDAGLQIDDVRVAKSYQAF